MNVSPAEPEDDNGEQYEYGDDATHALGCDFSLHQDDFQAALPKISEARVHAQDAATSKILSAEDDVEAHAIDDDTSASVHFRFPYPQANCFG